MKEVVNSIVVTVIVGLPGGYRNSNGNFNNLSKEANWWSASENNTENAWYRNLNYNNDNMNRNNNNKKYGFSVRCLRDLMRMAPALQGPCLF